MLILLPPSEGKFAPQSGPRLSLPSLAWPGLRSARREILSALVECCASSPARARSALGITAKQDALIEANTKLRRAPTAAAIEVYSGVLYEALNFSSLSAAARARGSQRIAIASALWGLVRPDDQIPAYRFSADSGIPGLPPLPQIWAEPVGAVICAESGLIVDLRSGAYEKLAPIPSACAPRAVSIRILLDRNGTLSVVSHHNKATKGRITAGLLRAAKEPTSIPSLVTDLRNLGYRVQEGRPTRNGVSTLDIIVNNV